MRGPAALDPLVDRLVERRRRGSAPGSRSAAARNRAPGRRSAAAPTGRRGRSGRPAAAPSRGRAPRRAGCRRGSARARRALARAASAAMPNTPSSSYRRTRPRTMSSLAPSAISRSRRAAASLRTSARISLVAAAEILRTPGSSSLHSVVDAGLAAGRRGGCRRDARGRSRRRSRTARCGPFRAASSSSISLPQLVEVEQALGDEERGDDLLQRRAFFLGQVERDARAEAVDEAVGDLGGDDLVAQAVGADGVGMRLAHRLGEGLEQLRLDQRVVGQLQLLGRVLKDELGHRQDDRELGPGQAATLLRAAEQLLARRRALRPCGRAGPTLRAARSSGRSPAGACAPPASAIDSASVCRRLSSSTSSATSSVIFASRLLRLSNDSRPSRISRLSGILMFTSLSEQSTPALLSMKSVLMRPPCSANSMRPAWVMPRFAPSPMTFARSSSRVGAQRVVGRIADVGLALRRRLDVGADAAEPEQVDRRLEDRVDQRRRVERLGVDAERLARFGAQRDRLLGAREDAAALARSACGRNRPSSSAAARTAACAPPSSSPDRDRDR